MVKAVIQYPNAVLRQKCAEVTEMTGEVISTIKDLIDTMEVSIASGIAAPQIGIIQRIIVIAAHVAKEPAHVVMINPVITDREKETQKAWEGCLSFFRATLLVTRPRQIEVQYKTVDGETKTLQIDGIFAQAVQHEIDHLNGRLLVDYAPRVKKEMIKRHAKKYRGQAIDYRQVRRG